MASSLRCRLHVNRTVPPTSSLRLSDVRAVPARIIQVAVAVDWVEIRSEIPAISYQVVFEAVTGMSCGASICYSMQVDKARGVLSSLAEGMLPVLALAAGVATVEQKLTPGVAQSRLIVQR